MSLLAYLNAAFPTRPTPAQLDEQQEVIARERARLAAAARPDTRAVAAKLHAELEHAEASGDPAAITLLVDKYGPLPLLLEARERCRQQVVAQKEQQEQAHRVEVAALIDSISTVEDVVEAAHAIGAMGEAVRADVIEELVLVVDTTVRPQLLQALASEVEQIGWNESQGTYGNPARVVECMKPLLLLQHTLGQVQGRSVEYPAPLWAFEELAVGFSKRFGFHFDGSSETNRGDRPEWALEYAFKYIDLHVDAVRAWVGATLAASPFSDRFGAYEFVTAVLVLVRRKMNHYFADLAAEPRTHRLLPHLVFEIQQFDTKVLERCRYNPHARVGGGRPARRWPGLTGDVLRADRHLEVWLEVEKTLALARLDDIVAVSSAFEIDYDVVGAAETKPTMLALLLEKLFENSTLHYVHVRVLKYRLQFLATVQLAMLDTYHAQLRDGLGAFQTLYAKTRRGKREADLAAVEGASGVERICRIYCSASHLARCMERWSEAPEFLQIGVFLEEQNGAANAVNDTLFTPLIRQFRLLMQQLEAVLQQLLQDEFTIATKSYLSSSHWGSIPDSTSMEMLPEVVAACGKLVPELHMLRRCLSHVDLLPVTGAVATTIARLFREDLLSTNRFSSGGAEQVARDWDYLVAALGLPPVVESVRTLQMVAVLCGTAADMQLLSERDVLEMMRRQTR